MTPGAWRVSKNGVDFQGIYSLGFVKGHGIYMKEQGLIIKDKALEKSVVKYF